MAYYFDLKFYENISELVMDYNGLANPFETSIQLGITNTYTATLYFKAELVDPPEGYSEYVKELGSIAAGVSAYKEFTFKRAHPASKVTDNLAIKVSAYLDASYTQVLSEDTLAAPYYLFDHDAMTLVDHDTFDTASDFESWSGWGSSNFTLTQEPTYYLNAPYSLRGLVTMSCEVGCELYGVQKTFSIPATAEAFLVYHYFKISNTDVRALVVAGKSIIPQQVLELYPTTRWHRICVKLPTNQNVIVQVGMRRKNAGYTSQVIDDVWVVRA